MRKLRYLALSTLGGNSAQYRSYDDILVHQEVRVKWWARELGRASKHAKRVFFDKILCRAHPRYRVFRRISKIKLLPVDHLFNRTASSSLPNSPPVYL